MPLFSMCSPKHFKSKGRDREVRVKQVDREAKVSIPEASERQKN